MDLDTAMKIAKICGEIGLPTVLGIGLKLFSQFLKRKEALQEGVMSLLHHRLYEDCSAFIRRGYVTVGELNDLEYIFTSYKRLKGNGTGEQLYNRVQELDIKEGGEYDAK